jgi:glucosamine 6-phosphate synthetase-like amidotransferase/phosphosugar isomerase protein
VPRAAGGDPLGAEIASQPDCWARALERAAELGAALPDDGARALAIGCGTSLHVARAYALLREGAGGGETDWAPASELPVRRAYDVVVAISRSGTTTEIVRALERVRARTRTVAIVADGASPVAALVDDAVVLHFADEEAVVQTRFPTTVISLLRRSLGEDVGGLVDDGRPRRQPADPKSSAARRCISSSVSSSVRLLSIHCCPNGSRKRPPRSP